MKKGWILFCAACLLLASCSNKKPIANTSDYNKYLQNGIIKEKAATINTEIDFWENRLQKDTGSFVNMSEIASYKLRLFKLTGNINDLRTGDSLLQRSSAKLNHTSPELLYSRSQTCITQHQFIQAAAHISDAEKAQGSRYITRLLQFDAYMELGKYGEAAKSLESLGDKEAFDYLIRKAKWEDHLGRLDNAILLMEKALSKVNDKNSGLYTWALSNLADMYGHAGRIKEAYQSYLTVLEKDPANLYCLKGIAWIAYSYDNNTADAKRILTYILSQTNMPDLRLMLADIAESEGNMEEKKKHIAAFVSAVAQPVYGDMYNKYLIHIYTEETKEYDKAYAIAQKELGNRFTPETCDWMAWVQYKMGQTKKAEEMARGFVQNKTFEPDAMIHTAFIYADAGKKQEAKALLNECLESSFEIGPLAVKQIREKLATL